MIDFKALIEKAAVDYNSGCCGCDRSSLIQGIRLTLSMSLPEDVVENIERAIRDRAEELYLEKHKEG